MKKILLLTRIHIKYQFTSLTLFLTIIAFLICFFVFLSSANAFSVPTDQILFQDEYYNAYTSNGFLIISTVISIFSIFLAISGTYEELLVVHTSRAKNIISKILSNAIIILIFFSLLLIMFSIFGLLFVKQFTFFEHFLPLLPLYLQGIFLMLISMFFRTLTNNIFAQCFLLISFWISKIFVDGYTERNMPIIGKILSFFLPMMTYTEGKYAYTIGPWYILVLIFFFLIATIYVYCNKDLKFE